MSDLASTHFVRYSGRMTDKPILLDLYCRAGGATVGYQRAGFRVIGVDIEPQSEYPGDTFEQWDALAVLDELAQNDGELVLYGRPDLIHASPPCQEGNTQTNGTNKGRAHEHPQLVPPTRALLDKIGISYVIEQPTSSRAGLIRRDLTLCMDMFKGSMPPPWVQKHRSFELSGFTVSRPAHPKHEGYVSGWRHRVHRPFGPEAPYVQAYGKGGGKATVEQMQHAQQMPWVSDHFSLREAIPPAYTEHIGRAFLAR